MKALTMWIVCLGILVFAVPGGAVLFQLDSISVGSADPGLVLDGGLNGSYTSPVQFNLDCPGCPGQPDTAFFDDLLELYNTEDALNADDYATIPLTLTFNFSLPSAGGQVMSGTSYGYLAFSWHPRRWAVDINSPATFSFSDGAFNYELGVIINPASADFGWNEHGYFDVTFALNECTPVPVPGAVWLLGSGLLGLVGFRRRPRKG